MKNIFTVALLLVGFAMFAQSTQTTSTNQTSANQTSVSASNPKAKALIGSWYLTQTENFGDVHKPTDTQNGDLLVLLDGGQYRFIYNGVAEGGNWTLDKSGVWITLTCSTGAIKRIKVVESTSTTLKVDFQDGDDVHNVLYYSGTAPSRSK